MEIIIKAKKKYKEWTVSYILLMHHFISPLPHLLLTPVTTAEPTSHRQFLTVPHRRPMFETFALLGTFLLKSRSPSGGAGQPRVEVMGIS